MKLFNSKPVLVFGKISSGWFWELDFDIDTGWYKLEGIGDFASPIDCHNNALEFCKENEIEISKEDWS